MTTNLPGPVKQLLTTFSKANYEIYIVGGAVRDILMGRMVNDWDFTTNATPEQILEIIPGGLYNNLYGTVFTENPEDKTKPYEITTFRKEEGYSDSRHPDKITWGKTLKEDLSRREATISALALDANFNILDYYHGQEDLKNKLFRAIGDPNERYQEDALRMMRAIRISTQLNFKIEEKTFEAINKNTSLINKVSKERIKEELFKLLSSSNPYEGMILFRTSGLMAEILPEMEKCFGVEQKSPGRHHIYDVGNHLLMSLKNCKSEDPITRFATLVHDIGKPQTYRKLESGVITFYNHEMVSTRIAENIAERLRFSKKEADKFVTLVRWHQFTVDEHQTDSAIRRILKNVGLENMEDMLALRVADRLGGGARETSWRLEEFKTRLIEVQKQPFSLKDLKINGRDVMHELGLKPGPKVGEILEKLFEEIVEKKVENKRETLLSKLKKDMKHVVVGIISRETKSGKEYLLVASNKKHGKYTNYFYPPGGHLEEGEDENTALVREIKEELNLKVLPVVEIAQSLGDVENQMTHWWKCKIDDTVRMRINNKEINEARWFSEMEIRSETVNIWPATKTFFNNYIFIEKV